MVNGARVRLIFEQDGLFASVAWPIAAIIKVLDVASGFYRV
jgi:hypothetical protein